MKLIYCYPETPLATWREHLGLLEEALKFLQEKAPCDWRNCSEDERKFQLMEMERFVKGFSLYVRWVEEGYISKKPQIIEMTSRFIAPGRGEICLTKEFPGEKEVENWLFPGYPQSLKELLNRILGVDVYGTPPTRPKKMEDCLRLSWVLEGETWKVVYGNWIDDPAYKDCHGFSDLKKLAGDLWGAQALARRYKEGFGLDEKEINSEEVMTAIKVLKQLAELRREAEKEEITGDD